VGKKLYRSAPDAHKCLPSRVACVVNKVAMLSFHILRKQRHCLIRANPNRIKAPAHDQSNASLPFVEMGGNVRCEVFGRVAEGFEKDGDQKAENYAVVGFSVKKGDADAALFP
jgi:hypothetical protein